MNTTGPILRVRSANGQTPRQLAARESLPTTDPLEIATITPGQAEQVLQRQITAGYKPDLPVYTFRDEYYNPQDFYWDIEAMIRHDSIKTPLSYVMAPISQMQVTFEGSSSRVVKWAIGEWEKFKETWLRKVQENAYPWGWMGAEVVYDVERGLEGVCDFKDFAARDTQPLVQNSNIVGIEVKNIKGVGATQLSGSHKGFPAKGFWYAHLPRYGQHYGQSQIEAAWKPWRRLTGRDGLEEIADVAVYRYGTGTVVIGAPLEDTKSNTGADTGRVSALQRVQEMGEAMKAGGTVVLPTTQYANGQAKWSMNFETPQTNIPEMLQAVEAMYANISKAIGFPPELLEAADTGSGFSGRLIPLQGFLLNIQPHAQGLFMAWFEQIGRPLMWWNFGANAWLKPKVVPLLQSYRQTTMGPQQPAGQPGAMPQPGQQPQQGPPQGTSEAVPPNPQADGKVPYLGPRGGKGWRDSVGRIHYGAMMSSAAFVDSIEAVQTADEEAIDRLTETLQDLEPEELDALEESIS